MAMQQIKKGMVLVLILFFLTFTKYMYGYLDPGTGSYVIQVILAAILGIGVAFRLFWHKIKGIFKKKPDTQDHIEEEKN
jgi:hypothetical protein